MNIRKKQMGLSIVSLVLVLAFLALGVVYGSQIAMGYLTQNTLKGIVKNALQENKMNDAASVQSIKEAISKKLSVNTIDVGSENFLVTKDGSGFQVDTTYIKEINVNKQIKIVMDLSFTESSN